MMVRNHLDDQAMSKLLMKSTHNKKVLEAHKKVLEAHKIVLEAHKSFRFSSIVLFANNILYLISSNMYTHPSIIPAFLRPSKNAGVK